MENHINQDWQNYMGNLNEADIDNNHNEQFILYIKYVFSYLETILKEEAEQENDGQ